MSRGKILEIGFNKPMYLVTSDFSIDLIREEEAKEKMNSYGMMYGRVETIIGIKVGMLGSSDGSRENNYINISPFLTEEPIGADAPRPGSVKIHTEDIEYKKELHLVSIDGREI